LGVEKFPTFGSYNISKYGLWGLTEILALELKQKNIRVNQVSPSGVDTELFYRAVPPGVQPSLSPEDVANIILYLASERSAPLSGENLRLFGK
jgi:NAD(P)-dependent dehydrogenase (short-subunit alcohol dehydrogenase family)